MILLCEMLIDTLRVMVNNPFLKKIMEKKVINILITFFISYKNSVKTFLKWIVNVSLPHSSFILDSLVRILNSSLG